MLDDAIFSVIRLVGFDRSVVDSSNGPLGSDDASSGPSIRSLASSISDISVE